MFINRGMDKEDVTRIYNGILLSNKKNETVPFAAIWMDLEIIVLSTINQTDRERQIYDITQMWNHQKNDTNELTYKIEIDSQTQRTNVWLPKSRASIKSLGLTDTHYYIENG